VAAATAGYHRLCAQPVHLSERLAGSTVTSKVILRTLTDALSVLARRHYTRVYHSPAAPVRVRVSPLTIGSLPSALLSQPESRLPHVVASPHSTH